MKEIVYVIIIILLIIFVAIVIDLVLKHNKNKLSSHNPYIIEDRIQVKDSLLDLDTIRPFVVTQKNPKFQKKINKEIGTDIMEFCLYVRGGVPQDITIRGTYVCYTDFKVMKNSQNILSILMQYYEYTGGAHGMAYNRAYNYNVATGEKIKISYLKDINADYKNIIQNEIKRRIKLDIDKYFDNILDEIPEIDDDTKFYITDDGIVVYYGLYEIAPYSSGIPEFKILYVLLNNNER